MVEHGPIRDPGRALAAAVRAQQILTAAMMASVALYGVMLIVLRSGPHSNAASFDGTVRMVVPGAILAGGLVLFALGLARFLKFRQAGLPPVDFARRAAPTLMLRMAGAEAVALAGFVASFVSGLPMRPFVAAAVVALGLMVAQFPTTRSYLGDHTLP